MKPSASRSLLVAVVVAGALIVGGSYLLLYVSEQPPFPPLEDEYFTGTEENPQERTSDDDDVEALSDLTDSQSKITLIPESPDSEKTGLDSSGHYEVTGIVVDDITGKPVSGAEVGANYMTNAKPTDTSSGARCTSFTHSDGVFQLKGVVADKAWSVRGKCAVLIVEHPEYALGYLKVDLPNPERVGIRLQKGFKIFGRTFDDSGKPLAGVDIGISGKEIFRPMRIESDEEGGYETIKLPIGSVVLCANPPPLSRSNFKVREISDLSKKQVLDHGFTEELRTIEIIDRDVEVNFGPEPSHITWMGVLFGTDNIPLPGAMIKMSAAIRGVDNLEELRLKRSVFTDESGRFEIHKLHPATYSVDLFFYDPQSHTEWENIAFDQPGAVVNKDIRLSGAEIAGQVIDGWTGKPMRGKTGTVHATRTGVSMKGYSSSVDGKGRFRLTGLAAGVYEITTSISGFPPKYMHGVRLAEGERLDNFEVTIPAGGEVRLHFQGFKDLDLKDFEMSLEHGDGQVYIFPTKQPKPGGVWEEKHILEAGAWRACFYFGDLGYTEQAFDILHGETTKIIIDGNELSAHPGYVSVQGSVRFEDGTGMASAKIGFYADRVPGLEEEEMTLMATADIEGRFNLDGIKPGRWHVKVLKPGGVEAVLQDLVIPRNASDPYFIEFLFPDGTVSGTLCDGKTGAPFSDEDPRWWIYLHDVKARRSVSELQGGHKGSEFRLEGVPDGTLQLTVSALGYLDYCSEAFEFLGGDLDVGEIRLSPCGILDLEVLTASDRPVSDFTVTCDGRELSTQNRQYLSPGKYRYFQVPLGPVELVIQAEGYPTKSVFIDLTPGKPDYVLVRIP